jgi:hypothetical protein
MNQARNLLMAIGFWLAVVVIAVGIWLLIFTLEKTVITGIHHSIESTPQPSTSAWPQP